MLGQAGKVVGSYGVIWFWVFLVWYLVCYLVLYLIYCTCDMGSKTPSYFPGAEGAKWTGRLDSIWHVLAKVAPCGSTSEDSSRFCRPLERAEVNPSITISSLSSAQGKERYRGQNWALGSDVFAAQSWLHHRVALWPWAGHL